MRDVLEYIADSPDPEHGGFDRRVTEAAKWARSRITTLERELAAAQAEVLEARDVLKNHARCPLPEREHPALKYFTEDKPCPRCRVTSRPPGSLSALEAWATEFGLKVAQVAASRGYQDGRAFRPEKLDMPAIVREELSRILGKEAAR